MSLEDRLVELAGRVDLLAESYRHLEQRLDGAAERLGARIDARAEGLVGRWLTRLEAVERAHRELVHATSRLEERPTAPTVQNLRHALAAVERLGVLVNECASEMVASKTDFPASWSLLGPAFEHLRRAIDTPGEPPPRESLG